MIHLCDHIFYYQKELIQTGGGDKKSSGRDVEDGPTDQPAGHSSHRFLSDRTCGLIYFCTHHELYLLFFRNDWELCFYVPIRYPIIANNYTLIIVGCFIQQECLYY